MATPQTEGNGNGRGRPTGRTRAAVIDPPAEETTERRGSASQRAGAQAAEILAPEGGLAGLDPVSFSKALGRFGAEVARRPLPAIAAVARAGTGLGLTGVAAAGRAVGLKTPGALPPAAKDKRFADRAWEENAAFFATGQAYRLMGRLVDDLLALAELEEPWNGKATFALRAMVDAMAPTNFLATNPAALKRAFETGGVSLLRGARNFMTDLTTNGGLPRKVDRSAFTVGKNIAATPGKVVFRNDLMELIQYTPTTKTTYEVPLLFSPPWINKYYIMDLAPGRSFAEWAVQHGHTVFQISYRNPDATMGHVRLDDYLLDGPRTALDVINDITGSAKVNMVGLCLGGSLTAMLLAYMAAKGDDRLNSATFLNTLVDFSEPGGLGTFSDPESVARIEAKMAKEGFLDSNEMSRTFDFMRANDLIWSYVASSWLMGEDPPGLRHPGLERGRHPDAGGHALLLPPLLLHREPAGPGRDDAGRHPARPRCGQGRRLRAVGQGGPHRPLDVGLQDDPAPAGQRPLHPLAPRATSPASSTRRAPRRCTGPTPTTPPTPRPG